MNRSSHSVLSPSSSKSPRYNERDVQFFCRWITERLRSGDIADVLVAVTSLQILLRRREYRPVFHAEDGVKLYVSPLCKLSLTVSVRSECLTNHATHAASLGAVLNDYTNKRQVLYQTLFCLWLLSYDEVPYTATPHNIHPPKCRPVVVVPRTLRRPSRFIPGTLHDQV
jgi:hypothetical protein